MVRYVAVESARRISRRFHAIHGESITNYQVESNLVSFIRSGATHWTQSCEVWTSKDYALNNAKFDVRFSGCGKQMNLTMAVLLALQATKILFFGNHKAPHAIAWKA